MEHIDHNRDTVSDCRGRRILQRFPSSWMLYPTLPVRVGARGPDVRLVQEWLNLHGLPTAIDGRFGPRTAGQLHAFRLAHGLEPGAGVDAALFEALAEPMINALSFSDLEELSMPHTVLRIGRKQLDAGAREIGGPNRGPWVRLYMNGCDGAEYPWCAGFASFVVTSAFEMAGEYPPLKLSVSCDGLARNARKVGRLISGDRCRTANTPSPGSLFLLRRRADGWTHCGIVSAVDERHFETIEGNTNTDGSPDGAAVCRRIRGFRNCDFVDLGSATQLTVCQ